MENQVEEEIDLVDLFYYLKKKIWLIVAAIVLCAAAGFSVSNFLMTPQYEASTRMYVLNRSSEGSVSYTDLQISNQFAKDYKVLITGQNVTKEVIGILGVDMTPEQLEKKIAVTAPDDTRVLQITVTDTDPQRAADIANCVREVASVQLQEIMDVDAAKVIYEADVPEEPSGPSVRKFTILGAALGFLAAVGILSAVHLLDDTIRTEEDVERYLGLGVLGVIPLSSEMGNTGMAKKKSAAKPQENRKK